VFGDNSPGGLRKIEDMTFGESRTRSYCYEDGEGEICLMLSSDEAA
jgi:hypothetical protein